MPLEGPPSKEAFFRYFQSEVLALQSQISRLPSVSPPERASAIDDVLADIARLSDEVKDAASYIPAYDQRTYGDSIKGLSEKLQSVREGMGAGKKKFKFKSGGKKSMVEEKVERVEEVRNSGPRGGTWSQGAPREPNTTNEEKVRGHEQEDGAKINDSAVADQGVMISDHDRAHIVLPASSHSGSSATVLNLRDSVIDLSPSTTSGLPFATLTLKNIKDSLVICGRIAGAIHITGVENSIIVVGCRQYRMHGSKKVDVYLHCSSRPIIEDCQNIWFAPLPQHFMTDDLSHSTNQWDQIDDFKWLKAEPSPHFRILHESDRIADAVWKDQVLVPNQENPEEILRSVGVSTTT